MFTKIYRNIKTFAFKELQEWDSWASINGAVQMLFLKPSRNMFAENILQSQKGFWLCCGSILFSMVGEFRFFEQNYCKMNDLFSLVFVGFVTFCKKIWNKKRTLMMSAGKCGRIKKGCMPGVIYLSKFRFWGDYFRTL